MKPATRDQSQLEVKLHDKASLPVAESQCYYALSYAAGSHKSTEEILVDGRRFNAFRTLATALRHIQGYLLPNTDPDGSGCAVWADQICINQSNPKERAYQVDHMREIYERARSTLIYLGGDKTDGRGMQFLQRILDRVDNANANADDKEDSTPIHNQVADWVVDHIKDHRHIEDWETACEIFKTSWWERGWVCQEAIVSRKALILYGNSQMPLLGFALAFDVIVRARDRIVVRLFVEFQKNSQTESYSQPDEYLVKLVKCLGETDRVKFIVENLQIFNEEPYHDIKSLLRHSRLCETTDPRDRVYAFIGLADPVYGIKPNYESLLRDTYIDAAARIILKERRLDILFDANENEKTPGLPSWVPNWSLNSTRDSMLSDIDLHKRFQTSLQHSADAKVSFPEASEEGYGRVLQIEVFCLGKLSLESTFGPANEGDVKEKAESWMQKAGYNNPESRTKDYISGSTIHDAFLSTLCLFDPGPKDKNHIRGSQPETQEAYEAISAGTSGMERVLSSWCFFVNPLGYMGVTPSNAKYNDYLCIASGAPVPFILRKCDKRYIFIGEAYAHGLMDGEASRMIAAREFQPQLVDII